MKTKQFVRLGNSAEFFQFTFGFPAMNFSKSLIYAAQPLETRLKTLCAPIFERNNVTVTGGAQFINGNSLYEQADMDPLFQFHPRFEQAWEKPF